MPWHRSKCWLLIAVATVVVFLFKNLFIDVDSNRTDDVLSRKNHPNATTVAFVVTITGCGNHFDREKFHVLDGAAVLAFSIHKNSIHGSKGGRYDYDLYAFHHPNASECALPLEKLGYIVQERETPVAIADIRNARLQTAIQKWGCCGERELIKFEAFTLTQYPVVALLDADTLVLQPLDRLFDFVLNASHVPSPDDLMYIGKPSTIGMNTNVTIPERIDLLYTSDYPMVEPSRLVKPTQGGFVVLRPNMTVYNDIVDIVKEGDYRFDGGGWSGRTGAFWGDTTFQGLIPFYFQILHPGRALELNYCVWNNNNFAPLQITPESPNGQCASYQEDCEDCRLRPIDEIGLIHFTACLKPWFCYVHSSDDTLQNKKCLVLHKEWFQTRSSLEKSRGRPGRGKGSFHVDTFLGFCHHFGPEGYQQINMTAFV